MLRWFPIVQVDTTCFSCSPPDIYLVTNQLQLNKYYIKRKNYLFNLLICLMCGNHIKRVRSILAIPLSLFLRVTFHIFKAHLIKCGTPTFQNGKMYKHGFGAYILALSPSLILTVTFHIFKQHLMTCVTANFQVLGFGRCIVVLFICLILTVTFHIFKQHLMTCVSNLSYF